MDIHFESIFGNVNLHYEVDNRNICWFYGIEIAHYLGYSRAYHMTRMVKNKEYDLKTINLHNPIVLELELDMRPTIFKVVNEFSAMNINSNYLNQKVGFNLNNDSNSEMKLPKGRPEFLIISEISLYDIIFNSIAKRPEIQNFKIWITTKVIPSIRIYGMYIDPETRLELEQNPHLIHDYKNKIKALEDIIEQTQCYTNLGEAVIDDIKTINNLRELAHVITQSLNIDLGPHKVNAILKEHGIISVSNGLLTQFTISNDLMRRVYDTNNGKFNYKFTNHGLCKLVEMFRDIFINKTGVDLSKITEKQLLYKLIDKNDPDNQ